jgi:hypothetical protein
MKTLTYKNVTRFSLPVVIKTADGARTASFNLPPQQTVDLLETQVTGDVRVKTKNGLLKLVSEEVAETTTTEFLKVPKAVPVSPKPSASAYTQPSKKTSNRDVTITTKEKD